jgi:hypothetical protein
VVGGGGAAKNVCSMAALGLNPALHNNWFINNDNTYITLTLFVLLLYDVTNRQLLKKKECNKGPN